MKFLKKNYLKIFLLIFLCIILAYVTNITSIPDSIILFKNEGLNLSTIFGVEIQKLEEEIDYKVVPISSNANSLDNIVEKETYNVSLFGKINIKKIEVNNIPNTNVVPLGNLIGLKLYTDGVLVVGMSEIDGIDDKKYKPYENSGIEEGDRIIEINDTVVTSTADLMQCVNASKGKQIEIKFIKDGNILETSITPIKTSSSTYKLGLWVRDAAAGVGTVSFYDPVSKTFAALGHGIIDVDTEDLLTIASGDFITTDIVSIEKGEEGNPGKIQGSIDRQYKIGQIVKNTAFGVYGYLTDVSKLGIDVNNTVPVALRDEIEKGPATIICTLENGKKEEYNVEIQKIFKNNDEDNKSMLVKVTDERLLEKTGGIIQGMSGSPVMQNGKLIGALTHVLVKDPTTGYAVFADIMIKQMRAIEN